MHRKYIGLLICLLAFPLHGESYFLFSGRYITVRNDRIPLAQDLRDNIMDVCKQYTIEMLEFGSMLPNEISDTSQPFSLLGTTLRVNTEVLKSYTQEELNAALKAAILDPRLGGEYLITGMFAGFSISALMNIQNTFVKKAMLFIWAPLCFAALFRAGMRSFDYNRAQMIGNFPGYIAYLQKRVLLQQQENDEHQVDATTNSGLFKRIFKYPIKLVDRLYRCRLTWQQRAASLEKSYVLLQPQSTNTTQDQHHE